jgi:hypothetical protein
MHHDLKIWPQYFQPVRQRNKTFEVRFNDRGYQAGDTVTLKEYVPPHDIFSGQYTGEIENFSIGYVTPIDAERVVFSLIELSEKPAEAATEGEG